MHYRRPHQLRFFLREGSPLIKIYWASLFGSFPGFDICMKKPTCFCRLYAVTVDTSYDLPDILLIPCGRGEGMLLLNWCRNRTHQIVDLIQGRCLELPYKAWGHDVSSLSRLSKTGFAAESGQTHFQTFEVWPFVPAIFWLLFVCMVKMWSDRTKK